MIIHSSDIIELPHVPNPQSLHPVLKFDKARGDEGCFHPRMGKVNFKNDFFAYMHIMEIRWNPVEDIRWNEADSSQNVNINFHMSGALDTRFSGISDELNMRKKTHNLVFSPDGGFSNKMCAGDQIEMFHLSIDKQFFADAIGCDDAWSEEVCTKLEKNRPFAGVKGTLDVTPEMQRLISEIRNNNERGAMRNLIIQSKTLELLALQIDQFRKPKKYHDNLRPDEVDKLYHLKTYLEANFLEELSLTDLARLGGLNEFKLKKGFKMLFGTTVFGLIRTLRMEYAKRLLLDNAMTVEEVADTLGYEHAQHFSIAFKKFTGQNPSMFGRKTIGIRAVA